MKYREWIQLAAWLASVAVVGWAWGACCNIVGVWADSPMGGELVVRQVEDPTPFPPMRVAGGKEGSDAVKATVLTRFGNGQCSGTLISPRNKDGTYHILTAYHCDPRGGTVRVRLSDQRVIDAVSVAGDRTADIRWLRTVKKDLAVPALAVLSRTAPPVGMKVWHRGFGVDRPGNLETGTVTRAPNASAQTEYRISVSPGDSGGGAFRADNDEVLGPWCCTTCLGCVGRVWAGSSVMAWHLRPGYSSKATALAVANLWTDYTPKRGPTFLPVLQFCAPQHGHRD